MNRGLIFIALFSFYSFASIAENSADLSLESNSTISREAIVKFLQSSQQLATLRQAMPEMQQFSDESAAKNTAAIVEFLEKSASYPDIRKILEQSDFANLTEFFAFSERLMAIKLYLQLENSNQASVFQTVEILQANVHSMKANSAKPEIIQQAEQLLAQQKQKAALIQASLDKLSEQDKLFAKQNQQWLIQVFSR